ncbi:MAG TPA: hypothetical protein VF338_02515, partial [Leptolinea sp.]
QMKSILLSTDYVPKAIEDAIKFAWKCKVFNHYGMTEMGLGGGVFCEAQYGYHLREADMYFEIIDPNSGLLLPDGEVGEVVFTTLTRGGMPLIRYRTGDFSRLLPEKCPCGTILKTLWKINGRIGKQVKIKRRLFSIADLDEAFFKIDGLINYRLEIMHSRSSEKLSFQLFLLQEDALLEEKIIEALHDLEIPLNKNEITLEMNYGYPIELASMKKRQIIERPADNDII